MARKPRQSTPPVQPSSTQAPAQEGGLAGLHNRFAASKAAFDAWLGAPPATQADVRDYFFTGRDLYKQAVADAEPLWALADTLQPGMYDLSTVRLPGQAYYTAEGLSSDGWTVHQPPAGQEGFAASVWPTVQLPSPPPPIEEALPVAEVNPVDLVDPAGSVNPVVGADAAGPVDLAALIEPPPDVEATPGGVGTTGATVTRPDDPRFGVTDPLVTGVPGLSSGLTTTATQTAGTAESGVGALTEDPANVTETDLPHEVDLAVLGGLVGGLTGSADLNTLDTFGVDPAGGIDYLDPAWGDIHLFKQDTDADVALMEAVRGDLAYIHANPDLQTGQLMTETYVFNTESTPRLIEAIRMAHDSYDQPLFEAFRRATNEIYLKHGGLVHETLLNRYNIDLGIPYEEQRRERSLPENLGWILPGPGEDLNYNPPTALPDTEKKRLVDEAGRQAADAGGAIPLGNMSGLAIVVGADGTLYEAHSLPSGATVYTESTLPAGYAYGVGAQEDGSVAAQVVAVNPALVQSAGLNPARRVAADQIEGVPAGFVSVWDHEHDRAVLLSDAEIAGQTLIDDTVLPGLGVNDPADPTWTGGAGATGGPNLGIPGVAMLPDLSVDVDTSGALADLPSIEEQLAEWTEQGVYIPPRPEGVSTGKEWVRHVASYAETYLDTNRNELSPDEIVRLNSAIEDARLTVDLLDMWGDPSAFWSALQASEGVETEGSILMYLLGASLLGAGVAQGSQAASAFEAQLALIESRDWWVRHLKESYFKNLWAETNLAWPNDQRLLDLVQQNVSHGSTPDAILREKLTDAYIRAHSKPPPADWLEYHVRHVRPSNEVLDKINRIFGEYHGEMNKSISRMATGERVARVLKLGGLAASLFGLVMSVDDVMQGAAVLQRRQIDALAAELKPLQHRTGVTYFDVPPAPIPGANLPGADDLPEQMLDLDLSGPAQDEALSGKGIGPDEDVVFKTAASTPLPAWGGGQKRAYDKLVRRLEPYGVSADDLGSVEQLRALVRALPEGLDPEGMAPAELVVVLNQAFKRRSRHMDWTIREVLSDALNIAALDPYGSFNADVAPEPPGPAWRPAPPPSTAVASSSASSVSLAPPADSVAAPLLASFLADPTEYTAQDALRDFLKNTRPVQGVAALQADPQKEPEIAAPPPLTAEEQAYLDWLEAKKNAAAIQPVPGRSSGLVVSGSAT